MSELFLRIVNMSISAGWLVLAVLGLRFVWKKGPKWVNVLLWGIVAVRLLFPLSMESAFSLLPSAEMIPETVLSGSGFEIQTGIAHVNDSVNNDWNAMTVLSIVWLIGMLLLAVYAMISYCRFRRKVDTAVLLRENIFQCESVVSPFVLGVIQPKIYLPFKMDAQKLEYVIAHERAHIRRGDHWWKPLGFLLLTVHWFNPLVWLAYVLLCRDIELACDERVIKDLNNEDRADYTQALVACSMNRRSITACPLAFGEVGVKERVKSIMNYKKPALWIHILAVISCAALAVCFLTDPVKAAEDFVPDGSYLEIRPEEAAKPPLAPEEEHSGIQEETESVTGVPEEDAADAQEEFEWTQEEYRVAEETLNMLKIKIAQLQAEYEAMIEAEASE